MKRIEITNSNEFKKHYKEIWIFDICINHAIPGWECCHCSKQFAGTGRPFMPEIFFHNCLQVTTA